MKFFFNFISFLLIMFGFSNYGCSLFEPDSPAASYIHIDSISLTTNDTSQGSSANRILDVWVIYDNQYLGTFPLPADIPLMGEGNHSVILKGGIIENGISGIRSAYPKYSSFEKTLSLTIGENITLQPTVSYISSATFPQLENFDDASLSLVTTSGGNAQLSITPANDPNAFEQNSGWAILSDSNQTFEVASATPFALPFSTPSYLELNYKTECDFTIGVYVTTNLSVVKAELLHVIKTSTWKKIYVNLSTLGAVSTEGIDYKIYLRAVKPPAQSIANLYFDNLKIVY
jgi:hypothetical protein